MGEQEQEGQVQGAATEPEVVAATGAKDEAAATEAAPSEPTTEAAKEGDTESGKSPPVSVADPATVSSPTDSAA